MYCSSRVHTTQKTAQDMLLVVPVSVVKVHSYRGCVVCWEVPVSEQQDLDHLGFHLWGD